MYIYLIYPKKIANWETQRETIHYYILLQLYMYTIAIILIVSYVTRKLGKCRIFDI